jgi:hypothetical protein
VDSVGYDNMSGFGALSGYKSLTYAPGENRPRIDMVDSSSYAIDLG